ncbi:unnamed protein product [Ectocarpus sp. 13 AM-2016]
MDVSKQLFHTFINRQQAYDLPVEVGLVSFGDDVDVPCEPTPLFENFRDEVDTLTPAGNTKLFDAISEACTLLEKWQTEWVEKADKRKEEANRKRKAAGGDQANRGPVSDEAACPPCSGAQRREGYQVDHQRSRCLRPAPEGGRDRRLDHGGDRKERPAQVSVSRHRRLRFPPDDAARCAEAQRA